MDEDDDKPTRRSFAARVLGAPRESVEGVPFLLIFFVVAALIVIGAIVVLALGTWWSLLIPVGVLVALTLIVVSDIDRYVAWRGQVSTSERRERSPSLRPLLLLFGGLVVVAAVGIVLIGHHRDAATTDGLQLTAAERRGQDLFGRSCGSCHTLAAAGTGATVGPNLDYVQPELGQLKRVIAHGAAGQKAKMPANLVPPADAANIAAYVHRVADRRNCCAP